MLFTDIVDSTRRAAQVGDQRWKMLLDTHDDIARETVRRFGGRWIKSTGDGILATFDGPRKAVSCAVALRTAFGALNIPSVPVCTPGSTRSARAISRGIAVHIAQRVCALGGAGDIIVSSAVTKLVHGSGLAFEEHGDHELKGVPGLWQLYAVKA